MQHVETWQGIAGVDRVHDPRRGPDGSLVSFAVEATVAGTTHPGTAMVRRADPPHEMQLEVSTRDLVAMLDVRLTPDAPGSRVEVAVAISTRTFLSGMFFPAVAAAIGSSIDRTVADFADRLAALSDSR